MHGVVVHVKIDASREQEARAQLAEQIVPMYKEMPGFKSGYWLRILDGPRGIAVAFFDSEAAARAAIDRMGSAPPAPDGPQTLESIEVFEVAAQA